MDRMLNIEQVAERLGTSPRFVRRLVAERRIAFNKVGRHVRFSVGDVEDFIQAGRVEPSPTATSFEQLSLRRSTLREC